MDYIFYYDIVAIVILLMLMFLFFMRGTYPTPTNKVYFVMLVCIFLSAATDLITIYSIPHSATFPLALNYLFNILYLTTFNGGAVLYYVYILTLTRPKHIRRLSVIAYIVVGIDVLFLWTSPLLHLGIYFDEQRVYQHGPLFVLLYVNSFFILFCSLILFIFHRKKLNKYQMFAISFFNVVTIAAVLVQMIWPRQLIVNLASTLFLVLVYNSLQNPEYYIDGQNGCYNEKAFHETIHRYMSRNTPFTLTAFTLDGFQYINQVLGSAAGNELIDSIVVFLHHHFGKRNVYRLKECHFVIFHDDSVEDDTVAQILWENFKSPRTIHHLDVLLTPYICRVYYPDFAQTQEDISNAMEYSLRRAMETHAKKVIVASQESLHESQRKNQIIHILKRAIRNHEFQVYYQPIYHTQTGDFSSAEALIRLWDEELGYIPPDEFIPMAEQNGMIIEIGEIVFRQVCLFVKNHDIKSLGVDYIEVNLSFVQCMQENLAEHLESIMREYSVEPGQINFEITETAGAQTADALRRNMDKLITAGSTFSMDDYGTGFSTANYLVKLPMDYVKIDKSILWPAMEDEEAFVILRHTVEMLKALHKKIIVEGVETEKMADVLVGMNCDYLQGYLYSKPIPQQEYLGFLKQH